MVLESTIYHTRTRDEHAKSINQSINHLYSHKPYTTVQRRHKYTYNKYRIDINIYTAKTPLRSEFEWNILRLPILIQ